MNKIITLIKTHRAITTVLVIGFCAALGYALYFHIKPSVDARAYDSIAWSLVQGTGYTETSSPVHDSAIGRLGPGYEFFLAFWYFIFGHQLWIIWVIQAILHVASGFLIYRFIKEFYEGNHRERYAVLGATFYIFFIDVLEFPAMLLTETLYIFLVLLGAWFGLKMWRRPNTKNTIFGMFFLVLAVLVRPPAVIVLFLLLGYLAVRKYFKLVLVGALVAILVLTPWTIRNYQKYHRFIVTSAILGYDLWVGNSPDSKHVGELTATKEIDTYASSQGLFAANKKGMSEVIGLIFSDPGSFLKLQLTKTSIYFSAARPAAFWFHLHGVSQLATIILSSGFAFVLLIFGLAGLWLQITKRTKDSWFLILATLAAPAGIIWIVAETRYRYQMYPFLIILGVLFLAELKQNWRAYLKPAAVALLLVFTNTAFDAIRNAPRVLERFNRLF
ncbi:MAG: glycosyltransferase family 39 protein [Candidatus Yanofskybacteria bacterium]|nr:glycosyltransferase family 39 protein [Candidatus Yanofskybacteria bacterium]